MRYSQQSAQRTYHDEINKNRESIYENRNEEYIKQNNYDHEEQNDTENNNYEYYESSNNDFEIDEKSEIEANIFFCKHLIYTRIKEIIYKQCNKQHSSRNKLHKHFKFCKIVLKFVISHHNKIIIFIAYHDEFEILHFDTFSKHSQKLNFHFWHYATMKNSINAFQNNDIIIELIELSIINVDDKNDFILNLNCIMSIINRRFFLIEIFNYIVKRISMSVKIRGINNVMMLSSEYIFLKFIIDDTLNEKSIVDKLRRQVHIINDLKTNMFIEFNILDSKRIMLNYVIKQLTIDNCKEMKIFMKITSKRDKINKIICVYDVIVVSFHSRIIIFICFCDKSKLFKNRDLMFMSTKLLNRLNFNDNILNHIIDVNMCIV